MSKSIYSIQEKLDSILDIYTCYETSDSELFDLDGFPALKWGTDTRFDNTGIPHSEETKKRMSEAHKDQVPWNKGIKTGPMSEETKKKLSAALTGRKLTQEHKDKIRKNGSCGRKSPESYKKGWETRRRNREMAEWSKAADLKSVDVL